MATKKLADSKKKTAPKGHKLAAGVVPRKTPRTRKPDNMTVEAWQIALRREFGREQDFQSKNLGEAPFFSDFHVSNPKSGRSYRVAIRGAGLGDNYCSCPDFSVNTLGTCKHIEWQLSKLMRKRGGKQAFEAGFHPPYSEVYLHHGAQREVRFRAGTACPKLFLQYADLFFDDRGALRGSAGARFEEFVRKAGEQAHDVRIYDDALGFVARLRDDAARCKAVERRFGADRPAAAWNKLLKAPLFPYQRVGAAFAAAAGRCIIADDMGLGKTIQAIAAAEILAQTAGVERVLVVCPTALKHQWRQEVERFSGRTATVVEGFTHERAALYKQGDFFLITNYDVVHRDVEAIRGWQPDLVILDEAQRIKNWKTRRAQAVKQIESEHAIVLTGTPLENRLEELHSIMEFVDRHHLGPLFRFLHEHQHVDNTGRVIGYRRLDRIKESLAGILIRRRKSEVLKELPGRTDKHFFVEMTSQQRTIHEDNAEIVTKIVAKWRRYHFLTEADQRRLMVAMQFMRMSCNSTFLIDKETDHSTKIDECHLLLRDLLEAPETKAVVFSQWLGTHELLIRRLNADRVGHAFYHGSLDSKARKEVLARFKSDPACRVLHCTDSGGVGLNLQEASVLINMDQPWNPAVLEQRIARIHRLGQRKHVQVYHFVSQGTIEHSMLDVLKFKTSMFEGVLDGGEKEVFLGGTKMKKFMESVEQVTEAMPAASPGAPEPGGLASEAEAPDVPDTQAAPPATPPDEALGALLATGGALLARFGQALLSAPAVDGAVGLERLVHRDAKTGVAELRIPLASPEDTRQLGDLLAGFAEVLRGMSAKAGR
ncbi:MAG: DEAD/DEAH box helicase [Candidatus Hydrogenedentes bacterium]|nr:DEAD/DEAH box helicase [Candidatus Hydrogenedentota bacterium]